MIIFYIFVISYHTIATTTSNVTSSTINMSSSMFNKLRYDLISGPVFNFR